MSSIKLKQNGSVREISFAEGENLSQTLSRHGITHDACCGGLGKCKKCTAIVDGVKTLTCQCLAKAGQVVEIADMTKHATSFVGRGRGIGNCNVAIDIGTTTINAAAIDAGGNVMASYNVVNPQVSYGADVIARISAANNGNLGIMQQLVAGQIGTIVARFQSEGYLAAGYKIFIAANTVMLHILFGCDCTSLGVAPYTPVFVDGRQVAARTLDIDSDSLIITLPCISGYVGADIVAGIYYVGMPSEGKYNVLLDLGTNAEIAIYDSRSCHVTAAAAGPCFEGAGISCGMSATPGAITRATLNGAELELKTVDNALPVGVCGSGLIDLVAIMWSEKVFDEYGTFEEDEDYIVATDVWINQQDIRQFQLAKSAIRSALATMLDKLNITHDKIENIYIGGGFSTKLNLQSAVAVGMLDKAMIDKYIAVDNSCLGGLIKYATHGGDLDKIARSAEYIDLSMDKDFANEFVENLNFLE